MITFVTFIISLKSFSKSFLIDKILYTNEMTSWNGYLVHIFLAQELYHSFTSVKFYIFSILNIFKMDVKDDDRETD